MKKINNRDEIFRNTMKVGKRIGITILCCVPIMIIFGYLTRNIIKSNVLQIVCFMIIMSVAVAIVELFARAKEKQREEEKEIKRDVFK